MHESTNQKLIRLRASYKGQYLWRNNVGAYRDERNVVVRYGLANETDKISKIVKSSDLIGITTIVITQEMVGKKIGVFTAIECKKTGWLFSLKNLRDVAQKAFHDIVLSAGGFAGFATSAEDYEKIIGLSK